jgi:putative ABC transport system permease protein
LRSWLPGEGCDVNRAASFSRSVSPGFAVKQRQVVSLSLPDGSGGNRLEAMLQSVSRLPGVKSAALSDLAPGTVGGSRTGIRFASDPLARSIEEAKKAFFRIVTPGFVRTAGIRMLRGREFECTDSASSTRAMIVSRQLAERYFPGEDVLGRAMATPFDAQPWTVVGIVDNIRQLGLDQDAYPEMYFPLAQWKFGKLTSLDLIVESAGDPPVGDALLRRAIADADPSVAVGKIRTMNQLVDDSTASRYFEATLMASFAAVALWIAMSGLYAVIAYLVETRRREIVIRMAVGATPGRVVGMVAREGAVLAAAGCVAGIAGALALERFLDPFLFGVSSAEPLIVGGAAGLMFVTVVLASIVPGARASRFELALVLRGD